MKELIKGAGIIFIIKIFGSLAFLAVNLLVSNLYGAHYLGVFSLLLALLQMTTIFSRVGLDVFTLKTIPVIADKSELVSSYLKKTARLLSTFSIISAILIILFAREIDHYLFNSFDALYYIYGCGLLIIPYTFFTVLPEILRGFDELKYYSIIKNALLNFSVILCLIVLYNYFSLNNEPAIALFLGIVISSIIAFTIIIIFLKKRKIPLKSEKYGENILKQSFPMFMTASVLYLMNNLDSFMIGYFHSEKDVGYYNACVRLSLGITFVLTAIKGYASPKFSKHYHSDQFIELKKLFFNVIKLTLILVSPFIFLIFIFPDFFLSIFGEEFKIAKNTLIVLNFTYLINTVFGPTGMLMNMTGNQTVFMGIILFSFLVNLSLNLIVIPKYGIVGAAYSTLISTAFWNVSAFIYLKKNKVL